MEKLCVVVSARASYSRIRSVLIHLKKVKVDYKVVLVSSATMKKYGDLRKFIIDDGLNVDFEIQSQLDIENPSAMAKTTALTILSLTDYFLSEKITAVMVVADRHETLAISVSSSYLGLRTIHLQGGERTGNIDDKVRFANSFLSDFHLVATNDARDRLLRMEFPQDRVVVVGCPSIDFALEATKRNINKIRFSGVGALPSAIIKKPFMIVAQHAETTSNVASREQIAATIQAVDKSQIGTIWIWPNPDRGGDEMLSEIRKARENGRLRNVHFEKSLSPEDFLCLINESSCIVGNSSVAVREGSFLGVPAVNIGTRQCERAIVQNARNVDFDVNEISFAISRQIAHGRFEPSDVYGSGGSGEKIARMIEKLI